MKMNGRMWHRWSERQPMRLGVTLKAGGQRPHPALCRDLGLGGMYVETDPEWLPLNSSLYVGFTITRDGKESHYRLSARVVRLSRNGAGLMFSDFKPEAAYALGELLYGRSPLANAFTPTGDENAPRAAQGA